MSTRTQMRARVRQELGDLAALNYVWTDTLLNSLLVEASDWYSRQFPLRSIAYKNVVSTQNAFVVSEGTLALVAVECPTGRLLPHEPGGGIVGNPYNQRAVYEQSWWRWGSAMYLRRGAEGDEIGALNLVQHVHLPWSRPDDALDWDGPEDDERLLILYTVVHAWLQLDGTDRKRGREIVSASERYQARLDAELAIRRRTISSRTLNVV